MKKVTIRTVLTCRSRNRRLRQVLQREQGPPANPSISARPSASWPPSPSASPVPNDHAYLPHGRRCAGSGYHAGSSRVEEAIQARKPKDMAIITEIGGVCLPVQKNKNKREVTVTSDGGMTYPINYGASAVTEVSAWQQEIRDRGFGQPRHPQDQGRQRCAGIRITLESTLLTP